MSDAPTGLRLVPFSPTWITHDKIDVHAIYRRPRFKEDDFGEPQREYDADGLPTWDLTGPLPCKQHNKYVAKGFEYVTLANRESLQIAGVNSTIEGDWRVYDQHRQGGPWNYKLYVMGAASTREHDLAQLESDCRRFGADVVEEMRKREKPNFRLPAQFAGIQREARPEKKPKETGKEATA